MAYGTINLDRDVFERFSDLAKSIDWKPGLLAKHVIHWYLSLDEDAQRIFLGKMSPEAEAVLLELLLKRARERAEKGPGVGRGVIKRKEAGEHVAPAHRD